MAIPNVFGICRYIGRSSSFFLVAEATGSWWNHLSMKNVHLSGDFKALFGIFYLPMEMIQFEEYVS